MAVFAWFILVILSGVSDRGDDNDDDDDAGGGIWVLLFNRELTLNELEKFLVAWLTGDDVDEEEAEDDDGE